MHTTAIADDDGAWSFHHRGDLSGKVRIFAPPAPGDHLAHVADPVLEIDTDTLIEFVGRVLQRQHVARIESMTGIQYLDWSRELS